MKTNTIITIIAKMMIDIHTHILPGMDDGARDIEEGIKITELLFNQGISGAVCTPHYYPFLTDIKDFESRRKKAMEHMNKVRIPLFAASETYFHEYLFLNDNLEPLKIHNTDYLLLEMPFKRKWDKYIYEDLEKLNIHFNLIPIIAHIERYPAVKKRDIKRLKELGCVMQLNTSSLLNKKVKKRALSLIRTGLIDVLGSDCHNLTDRPPRIKTAMEIINKKLGKSYCEKLIKNSALIIEGKDIR